MAFDAQAALARIRTCAGLTCSECGQPLGERTSDWGGHWVHKACGLKAWRHVWRPNEPEDEEQAMAHRMPDG